MNTTELLGVLRTEVFDTAVPYLWSDSLLYTYIDAAQKQFCRDTYGIADSRGFTIPIVPGTVWYTIDPKILKLRSVADSATGVEIPLIAVEKMSANSIRLDGSKGPIKALITGMEENALRAWPVPNVASTLELRTYRLSVDALVANAALEVDSKHQLYLLYWVKYLAYNVQDTETYDPKASAKFKGLHDAYCAVVKGEQSRVSRPVSTVAYGGL